MCFLSRVSNVERTVINNTIRCSFCLSRNFRAENIVRLIAVEYRGKKKKISRFKSKDDAPRTQAKIRY